MLISGPAGSHDSDLTSLGHTLFPPWCYTFTGGLVVYKAAVPHDWNFDRYNGPDKGQFDDILGPSGTCQQPLLRVAVVTP